MYINTWDNADKTIVKQTVSGRISAEEMRQGMIQLGEMIDSVDHDVFMITVVDNWIWLPKDFGSIVRDYDAHFRKNLVLQLIVGSSYTLRLAMNLASIVAPQSFELSRMVKSEAEAYELIAQYQQGSPV